MHLKLAQNSWPVFPLVLVKAFIYLCAQLIGLNWETQEKKFIFKMSHFPDLVHSVTH